MWAQGMSFDLNIMQEHFKATNCDQNWTSHFEHGCLSLDNVYDRNVSLLIIQVTKNNSAFFISSRNLKNGYSRTLPLLHCDEFLLLPYQNVVQIHTTLNKFWGIDLGKHSYSHTFVCFSSQQRISLVDMP